MQMYNALIRTHHITSKKKIAKLKQAASHHNVLSLLRSGGAPGIMYVEGQQTGVQGWVDDVHNLRYKDYQLAVKPNPVEREDNTKVDEDVEKLLGKLHEIDTVSAFAQVMRDRGVHSWWRRGMGYESRLL